MFNLFLFKLILFLYKFSEFSQKIPRPFSIRYNPYTQSIEVINSKNQIINIVKDLRSKIQKNRFFISLPFIDFYLDELNVLEDALNKLKD